MSFLRRGAGRPGAGAGVFGGFDEVFHPSGRFVQEERDRRHALVDDVGSGAPPLGVDLQKGTVRLTRPKRAPVDDATDW